MAGDGSFIVKSTLKNTEGGVWGEGGREREGEGEGGREREREGEGGRGREREGEGGRGREGEGGGGQQRRKKAHSETAVCPIIIHTPVPHH